jgi:hypothetical protein
MSVLGGTAARLRGLRPDYPDAYGVRVGVPAEPGWWPLPDLDVAGWCTRARETDNPRRLASVAAATVGGALAHAVLGRVTAALVLERRAWDVSAERLAVHPESERVAVVDDAVLVLPDDPAAGSPDVEVVADLAALVDRVAAAAVGTLAPLFDAVRAATRYGIVPLWNGAADVVRSAATYVPLYAGTDRDAAREVGAALVDALIARGAGIRGRGGVQPVAWGGQTYAVPVRSACCLYYKTEPDVQQSSDAYCMTCPFLDAPDRERRFGTFVDELMSGGR